MWSLSYVFSELLRVVSDKFQWWSFTTTKNLQAGKSDVDQTVLSNLPVSPHISDQGSIPKMSSRYANTTQDMETVSQPMRGQHYPALTNQEPDLVFGISWRAPCSDTDPESQWSELHNYTELSANQRPVSGVIDQWEESIWSQHFVINTLSRPLRLFWVGSI